MLQRGKRDWVPAQIVRKDQTPDSYWVKAENGKEYRRNRSFLRPRNIIQNQEEPEAKPTTEEVPEQKDPVPVIENRK